MRMPDWVSRVRWLRRWTAMLCGAFGIVFYRYSDPTFDLRVGKYVRFKRWINPRTGDADEWFNIKMAAPRSN
jgi:hypothetical protein